MSVDSRLPQTDGISETGERATAADGGAPTRAERKLPYVAGFDGLRGIGIVLMLLYHAEVVWLGNGALFTIEMFFVLSGFLITYLFIIERHNHGRIDLKQFWSRRGRRLLPAIFGIVALAAVWAMFQPKVGPTPIEVNRMNGDGVAALLYGSNWWQLFSGQSYFEKFTSPSPFKHTWSLSVEEQFYLLIAIVAFFGFRRWGHTGRKWLVFAFGGALVAAIWMAFLARMGDISAAGLNPFGIDPTSLPSWMQTFFNVRGDGDPSRPYLGTDTRIGASLMGVGAAFLVDRADLGKLKKSTAEIMLVVGVGGLLLLFFGIPSRTTPWIFYGVFLICDILTLLAIVGLMAPHRTLTARLLSWRPLVFLGLLSYSLYVWHFPIFVILDESRVPFRGWLLDVVRIGVAFVVAYLSFRYFEQPIRRQGLKTRRVRIGAAVAVAAVVITFLVASRPYPDSSLMAAEANGSFPLVLLAGDSMAFSLAIGVRTKEADYPKGVEARSAGLLGCGIGDADLVKAGYPVRLNPACRDMVREFTLAMGYRPAITAMLAWGWDLYDRRVPGPDGELVDLRVGTPEWATWYTAQVQRGVDALSAGGTRVALLTMPCIDMAADLPRRPDPVVAEPHRVQAVNSVLTAMARRDPGRVVLVDLGGFLCPDGRTYRARIDGVAVSDDGLHFTPEGAVIVWNWLEPQLAQARAR
ncbi:MAG: acyltransferase [Actinobacteria bacterium]|nr:acyltransferase [Actinomycetota bacterium]